MLTCKFSELAATIEEGSVPKWLLDYVNEHREEMAAGLRKRGIWTIDMPGGGQIIVRQEPEPVIEATMKTLKVRIAQWKDGDNFYAQVQCECGWKGIEWWTGEPKQGLTLKIERIEHILDHLTEQL